MSHTIASYQLRVINGSTIETTWICRVVATAALTVALAISTQGQATDTLDANVASACAEGYRLYARQDYASAEIRLREAIAKSETSSTAAIEAIRAGCLVQLAATQRKEQKYAEAEVAARGGVKLFERQSVTLKLQLSSALVILADVLEDEGKYSEAISVVERSWSLETGHQPTQPIEYRDKPFLRKIGLLSLKNNQYDRAAMLLQQNLTVTDRPEIKYHGQIVPALNDLAAVYMAQARWNDAEALLHRALAIAEQWPTEVAQESLLATLDEYAELMRKTNREGVAERFTSRARSIRERASAIQ